MSKSSQNYNVKLKDIYQISEGQKVMIFSTSKGIMTSLDLKKNRIGGKLFVLLKIFMKKAITINSETTINLIKKNHSILKIEKNLEGAKFYLIPKGLKLQKKKIK